MKKLIFIFVTVLCLTSCGKTYEATIEANYDVCYPDTTITYDKSMRVMYSYSKSNYNVDPETFANYNYTVKSYSYNGTNCISCIGINNIRYICTFESSTAPMRLNSYNIYNVKRVKKEKKIKKNDNVYMNYINNK